MGRRNTRAPEGGQAVGRAAVAALEEDVNSGLDGAEVVAGVYLGHVDVATPEHRLHHANHLFFKKQLFLGRLRGVAPFSMAPTMFHVWLLDFRKQL